MTSEEVVTTHVAAAVRSYRDLPLILYHFQVKERDEPRPRAGVLRTREFIMKDSYTFDRDAEGLEVSLPEARGRLRPDDGPVWPRVVSGRGRRRDDGRQRRPRVHGAVPRGRERGRARGRLCLQPRGGERRRPARAARARRSTAPQLVATPGMTTIDAVAERAEPPGGRAAQGVPGRCVDGDEMRLVILRGDHRVNEIKLANALRDRLPPRPPRRDRRRGSGPPGYIGPVGAQMPILLDAGVAEGAYVTGANEPDAHLRGVEPGRDFPYERVDVAHGGGWGHDQRHRDPDRAGDRGGEHLQARDPVFPSARSEVSRRVRTGAADPHGLLRLRAGARRGRGGRAVRR